MPIYPPRPDPFECAICGKARPLQWLDPTQTDYPPLCWACEQHGWRLGPITRKPDMRLAKQIAALSEALAEEASRKIYEEARHG
ncbi:hypothetical protein [Paracoccus sp. pheM1]|uniref:hypothetical protein n=1 Tax=Paracoccus sp. pheM1 TaxID=2831675 RepID=UPI00091DD063|nr:hypothetical protein [Paracoccus sp. pheM1]MBT0779588.1 hypothetical protein [Paracoccus sp. pheM1]SFY22805.1 hypothetical protein SAMN04244548_03161 [Paracoccus pantotrophus]